MRLATVVVMLAVAAMAAPARADAKDDEIAALKAQVAQLEARLADLESKQSAQQGAEANKTALQQKARERMAKDLAKRPRAEFQEAEQLYQVANKNWRSPEAKASLEKMIEKYPDLNRTGCAIVYLAQYAEGPEKERLLKQAIADYPDCFYGDGVQVGAYARFLLAHHYAGTNQPDLAKTLAGEIRKDYPGAIDHRGRLLDEQLSALEKKAP